MLFIFYFLEVPAIDYVWKSEGIKTLSSLVVLSVTWFVGQQILGYWEKKKKRKEAYQLTANQFQQLYAEFKTISRLWKAHKKYLEKSFKSAPKESWDLLCRATTAEGNVEAILMNISMERKLSDGECQTLGLFRQSYQQLRENIREDKRIELKTTNEEKKEIDFNHGAYYLFHELSVDISNMIASGYNATRISNEEGKINLEKIMLVREKHWLKKVEEHQKKIDGKK